VFSAALNRRAFGGVKDGGPLARAIIAPPLRILLLDDDLFLSHRTPRGHPERPERLLGARRGLARRRDAMTVVAPRPATVDELAAVHDRRYLRALREATAEGEGRLDPDTSFGPGTWEAALGAAGGVLDVTRAVVRGDADLGIGLVRPPGHHAERDRAMGFCLLNNVAVAAAAARAEGAKVLVLDWDVHHGNGTQHAFEADPGVLFFSIHQSPFYPGTGKVDEVGRGEGAGFTVNVPLAGGATDASYAAVCERLLLPVGRAFGPDLVLVSAGFDAGATDPLAGMEVSSAGFRALGGAARALCPRVVLVLEGGYDVDALGDHLAAAIEGAVTGDADAAPGRPRDADRRAMDRVVAAHGGFWGGLG
jgi:acetoin utilization deacetylase AcuC-like enzyme